MTKCPHCGSTAQVEELETAYEEDGWKITVYRDYMCDCGCHFFSTAIYVCQDEHEELTINSIDKEEHL